MSPQMDALVPDRQAAHDAFVYASGAAVRHKFVEE